MTTVRAWRRLTADDEGGFSLVEMVVSIFILGITLLALLSTLVTALHASQRNEARVAATALSNELLERMVALPWDRLGLYEDEVPSLTFEGQEVVLLPGSRDEPDPVPRAIDQQARSGRDFTVRRWVTWVEDGDDQDFKRLVVQLEWDVHGTTHSMRTESLRSPNPAERQDLEVRIVELVNADTGYDEVELRPSEPFTNEDAVAIEIAVTDPAATVWVSFIDRSGTRQQLPTTNNGLTRSFTIGVGAYEFAHGPASFAVLAETTGPDGESASNVETIRFLQPLVVGTPVLSHQDATAPICVDGEQTPVSPVAVEIAIAGMSGTAAVAPVITLAWGNETVPLEPVTSTVDGGIFRADVPGPFEPGSIGFEVVAQRTTTDPDLSATASNSASIDVREEPC